MEISAVEATFHFFYTRTQWALHFLTRIYNAKTVVGSQREKTEIFEAFVFKICATWEMFIENLLIDCLTRDTSQYAKYTGYELPRQLTRNVCKAIVFGTGYPNYKSVSHLKGKARTILARHHNPFNTISRGPTDRIDEFYIIRNYLAHYSDAAQRSLYQKYKKNHGMRKFQEPGDFLISSGRKTKHPRMIVYVNAFVQAAQEMEDFLTPSV